MSTQKLSPRSFVIVDVIALVIDPGQFERVHDHVHVHDYEVAGMSR